MSVVASSGRAPVRVRVLNHVARVVAWVLLLIGAGVPLYAYLEAARPPSQVSRRIAVPRTPSTAVPILPESVALPAGVPVLAYDDVSNRPSPWSVTPRELDAQLAALRASGFNAITPAQLTAWRAGRAELPTRPVLLTFDGGTKDVWRYADRIVERYGLRATVLPITGRVSTHQPYYLTWAELRAMRRSGRWDVGSHSHAATGAIQVNPAGRERGFVTNLRWDRVKRRQETLAQYRARIAGDLDASIAALRRHGLPRPQLLSYPHTLERAMPNDRRIPATLAATVRRRFPAALDTRSRPAFAGRAGDVQRIDVRRGTSARQLLKAIVAAGHRTSGV